MPDISIIQTIGQLPIGVLTPLLDHNGPYGAGNHIIDTWNDAGTTRNVSDTFGVIVQAFGSIAPELGRSPGFDDGGLIVLETFEDRITQLAALHQMLGGAWAVTQYADVVRVPTMLRWAEALPGRIGLFVGPTWNLDLFFLRAL